MAARMPKLHLGIRQTPAPVSLSRSPSFKVETLIRELCPQCSEQVLAQLNQEGITVAEQLAEMDKQDLREVGFNMAERNRILQWVRSWNWSRVQRDGDEQEEEDDGVMSYPSRSSMRSRFLGPGTPSLRDYQRTGSNRTMDPYTRTCSDDFGFLAEGDEELDDLETQEEFWCRVAQPNPSLARQISHPDRVEEDVRETLLEQQFDCTPERIHEVFRIVMSDSGTSDCVEQLKDGLQRFGIIGMGEQTLKQIIKKFTGDTLRSLKFNEFESVLTRLKLAQLLIGPLRTQPGSPTADAERLIVCDYSASSKLKRPDSHQRIFETITASNMKEFFFGHRQKASKSEHPVVRWVHMSSFEKELLLALTVKYTLHPLGVEDVFEQCPTKVDRYGCHYFIAIELLTTATESGQEMVVVDGRHVTVFCAGPPLLDTVITMDQAEKTFEEEWPRPLGRGGESSRSSPADNASGNTGWLNKLRDRFKAGRSRLCERRADFLVYTIVDVCTDEIVRVTRAYIARVSYMEGEMRRSQAELRGPSPRARPELPQEIFGEAVQAQLQLAVVARRVKCLRSVVRRILKDGQFCGPETSNYWADCEEHLDDAYDDAMQCGERCAALIKAFERALDKLQDQARHESQEQWRQQQLKDEQQGERLNKILFVMTVGELCFAPVQFMAGVYGMNFVDGNGDPTMPELLMPNGYRLFWQGVVTYLVVALIVTICIYRKLLRASNSSEVRNLQVSSGTNTSWQLPGISSRGAQRQDGQYVALASGDNERRSSR